MSNEPSLPPPDVEAERLNGLAPWVDRFLSAEIPVLQSTADTLESLRANEDLTDANSIGEVISNDPLMTLKVFVAASSTRAQRETAPAETATAALVMMGISPFFQRFGLQPTVEDRLSLNAEALSGFSRLLERAYRGANFALAMAVHRADPHAAAVHAAALLHEFTEMLLWVEEPLMALRVQEHQSLGQGVRSQDAQLAVLGVRLGDVQDALASAWKLPILLRQADNLRLGAPYSGIRMLTVAANLARHTTKGWDDAAVLGDIDQISSLLNMSSEQAMQLMQAVEAN